MTMGGNIAGMRGSGDWDSPDMRPKHWEEMAFRLNAKKGGNAKLIYFLSKLSRKSIKDYQYYLFEDREPTWSFTLDGNVAAAGTTITLTATPYGALKAGDVLLNETTLETFLLTENPTSGALTLDNVVRHQGSTAAGLGMSDGDIIRWVGSSYGEGTRSALALSRNPEDTYNYLQIFKESGELSGSAQQIDTRPFKNAWAREKELALERYINKVEFAILFGAREATTDAEGKRLTYTNGIYRVLSSNAFDFSSTGVNLTDFEDDLEDVFKYGSMEKLWVGGRRTITIITRMVSRSTMGTYALEDVDRKVSFGLRLKRFYTPHGDFVLVPHELMTRSAKFTQWAFLLDPEYLRLYNLNARYTKWDDNNGKGIQNRDEDSMKGQYMGELGMGLALEEVHGVFKGMNAFVP